MVGWCRACGRKRLTLKKATESASQLLDCKELTCCLSVQTIEHLRYYAGWADKIYGGCQDTLASIILSWHVWQGCLTMCFANGSSWTCLRGGLHASRLHEVSCMLSRGADAGYTQPRDACALDNAEPDIAFLCLQVRRSQQKGRCMHTP